MKMICKQDKTRARYTDRQRERKKVSVIYQLDTYIPG